jgi:hypothetical protein
MTRKGVSNISTSSISIVIIVAALLLVTSYLIINKLNKDNSINNQSSNATLQISDISELLLNTSDLTQIGISSDGCRTEEYETSKFSPVEQFSMCNYTINTSEIIIELSKFTNFNDLNGSYQYNSGHLQGAKGIISLNTFGDQSRFSKNSDDDYGAEFNKDNISYYHLWFTKDLYMVHVTSKGVVEDKVYVGSIGKQILSKFG